MSQPAPDPRTTMAVLDPDAPELAAAARLVAEQLERLSLTPAERAEVHCLALGVPSDVSAAARGVSPGTIRARRRRIGQKLVAMLGGIRNPAEAQFAKRNAPGRSLPPT